MEVRWRVLGVSVCLIGACLPVPGRSAVAPKPSLAAESVSVPPAKAGAPAVVSLVLVVDGVDANNAAEAAIKGVPTDLSSAAAEPPKVSFEAPVPLGDTGAQRRWVLPMKVTDMPAGANLTRYVSFKLGNVDWTLGYRLTSLAAVVPTPTTWSLKPAPLSTQSIEPGQGGLAFSVSVVGTAPIAGLVGTLQLTESGSKRQPSGSGFRLCAESPVGQACNKAAPTTLGAGTHNLWLVPTAKVTPGKYEGLLTVSSADKPGGESANVTLNVSSVHRQSIGAGLIALGVVSAWLFTTFLRHCITRDQMRLAAALLRTNVEQVARTLSGITPAVPTPEIKRMLESLRLELTDAKLKAFGLPQAIPLPGQASGDAAKFNERLKQLGDWVRALQVLVADGIKRLADLRATVGQLSPAESEAFDTATRSLDQLVTSSAAAAPTADALVVAIRSAVESFEAARSAVRRSFAASFLARDVSASPEFLRVRIGFEGALGWLFLGAVTVAAGSYILVLVPGFGTDKDLLGCLLWGLGLPAGTLLASTTTASIASTYNTAR